MSTSPAPHLDQRSAARVSTAKPARYGKQLTSHMGRKLSASWDDERSAGRLAFDRDGTTSGVVDLSCEEGALVLELATTLNEIERLEQVVGIHLARFGYKDGLTVAWQRAGGASGTTQGPLTEEDMERVRREREERRAREDQATPSA